MNIITSKMSEIEDKSKFIDMHLTLSQDSL